MYKFSKTLIAGSLQRVLPVHIGAHARGIGSSVSAFLLGILMLFLPITAFSAGQATTTGEGVRAVANMFRPLSRPAHEIHHVSLLAVFICAGIFAVVTFVLFYSVIRFRRRSPQDDLEEPPQVYGGSQIEMAWTILPILIALVLILVTARTIGEIQNHKIPEDAVRVRIIGHQWWWEVHYPEYGFITANEIHIPVSGKDDRRVSHIILESMDVIHSFWVPQLAGKTDLVPNKKNETWVEPYETGIYLGNCAEYCGTQHAHMLLRVFVHEPEEFEKWVASQKAPPVQDPTVAQGHQLFYSLACVSCHTVDGTPAEGKFGPDLTHLMSRETIGAGVAMLTHESLYQWVLDPQKLKEGCLMPDMKLSKTEAKEITRYLESLR